jgi:tRNASer (uridine44-2'-O)-methyltransferase
LPRKPNVDKPLEQDCLFLTGEDGSEPKGLVILLPDVKDEKDVPFYHPVLRKLAFEYIPKQPCGEKDDPDVVPQGTIKISALPFPNSAPLPVNKVQEVIAADIRPEDDVNRLLPQRTVRTCMHLLETLYKHGWGQQRGYEKRVVHDVSEFRSATRSNFENQATGTALVIVPLGVGRT